MVRPTEDGSFVHRGGLFLEDDTDHVSAILADHRSAVQPWRAWHVEVNHWPLGFVPRETGRIATQEPGVEVECFVGGIHLVSGMASGKG